MRKSTVRMIHEVKLDRVTLTHPYELAGDLPTEGPKVVLDSLGDREVDLADLELDDELTWLTARDAGWNHRSIGENRVDGRIALTGRWLLCRTALALRALRMRGRWNEDDRASHRCRHGQKQQKPPQPSLVDTSPSVTWDGIKLFFMREHSYPLLAPSTLRPHLPTVRAEPRLQI